MFLCILIGEESNELRHQKSLSYESCQLRMPITDGPGLLIVYYRLFQFSMLIKLLPALSFFPPPLPLKVMLHETNVMQFAKFGQRSCSYLNRLQKLATCCRNEMFRYKSGSHCAPCYTTPIFNET